MPVLTRLVMGDFKWTALGVLLVLLALLLASLINRRVRSRVLRFVVAAALVGSFVWFGHAWADPRVHALEQWYCCSHPWGEPMHLRLRGAEEQLTFPSGE